MCFRTGFAPDALGSLGRLTLIILFRGLREGKPKLKTLPFYVHHVTNQFIHAAQWSAIAD